MIKKYNKFINESLGRSIEKYDDDSFDNDIPFDDFETNVIINKELLSNSVETKPIDNVEIKNDVKNDIVLLRLTTKLKNVFKSLQKKNETKIIANEFLSGIRKIECDISFFDIISDKNEYLSFLPKNRVINLERTVVPVTSKSKKTETNKVVLNAYKSNQRQEMRLGKIINKLFPNKFTTKDIEIFVNEYKGEHDLLSGNINIKIVEGKDIAYWYDYKNYNQNGGTLNNSCMKNVPSNVFDLYVLNPNQIKMAIYERNKKLEARALVWYTDKGIYMDRIYYTKDHLKNCFEAYAERNNWMHRNQNQLPRLTVTLENVKRKFDENHPYLDSFNYNKGVLKNNI